MTNGWRRAAACGFVVVAWVLASGCSRSSEERATGAGADGGPPDPRGNGSGNRNIGELLSALPGDVWITAVDSGGGYLGSFYLRVDGTFGAEYASSGVALVHFANETTAERLNILYSLQWRGAPEARGGPASPIYLRLPVTTEALLSAQPTVEGDLRLHIEPDVVTATDIWEALGRVAPMGRTTLSADAWYLPSGQGGVRFHVEEGLQLAVLGTATGTGEEPYGGDKWYRVATPDLRVGWMEAPDVALQ